MGTIDENLRFWSETYTWFDDGEEWSEAWGGAEAEWFGMLYPRIHSFLPAGTVLEIAPGRGRWTEYLRYKTDRLIVVDLVKECVDALQVRFAGSSNIEYFANDGRSLPMVADQSVDFAFSFDSLVHAEADVLEAYISEFARTLMPDGVGFVHHSNLGERADPVTKEMPEGFVNYHWRATSTTAALFENLCERAGLQCISQEIVDWCGEPSLDCFSLFTRRTSKFARPNRVLRNDRFMVEAEGIRLSAPLYTDMAKGRVG
jgi:SAM-dependent methyltransferase